MIARNNRILTGAVCTGVLLPAVSAMGAPPTNQTDDLQELRQTIVDLQQQVRNSNQRTAELEQEVARLRQDTGDDWLTAVRAEEMHALVQDVLADADRRANLQGNGGAAGWNNGFYLASADGTFRMNVAGQTQVRYLLNSRDDSAHMVDDWEGGFSLRRVKLNFSGHIGSPKLNYVVQLAANRNSTTVELEDAVIGYQINDSTRIWAGRFQDSFSREQMMSSKRQQTVDRSAVANVFAANDGYVEGFGVEWVPYPECLKLAFTINDGLNSGTPGGAGTGFQNTPNDFQNDSTDFAFSARADWKIAGAWNQASDVTSWSGDEDVHAFLGAGVHYEIGETGDSQASATTMQTGPYDSFLQWTVDGLVKSNGLGVMAVVYGWHFDATSANAIGDTDHYGATIQAGYMLVPDEFEPFLRYEWIDIDSALSTNDLQLFTAGFNWYLHGHSAKFTADVVWAMDNINATTTLGTGLSGIGLLSDAMGEEDQAVARLQFQLLF